MGRTCGFFGGETDIRRWLLEVDIGCGVAREGTGCIKDPGSKKEKKTEEATEANVGSSRKFFQSQKHGHYMNAADSEARMCHSS